MGRWGLKVYNLGITALGSWTPDALAVETSESPQQSARYVLVLVPSAIGVPCPQPWKVEKPGDVTQDSL